MELDRITQTSLLYDFYGQLLTKRQCEVMTLYHEENLSLSEIAEEFSISRQGVHDALKNAEKSLYEYEQKLGLVKRMSESRRVIEEIDKQIDTIRKDYGENKDLTARLTAIKSIIDKLDQ